jgi:hypothetical protein
VLGLLRTQETALFGDTLDIVLVLNYFCKQLEARPVVGPPLRHQVSADPRLDLGQPLSHCGLALLGGLLLICHGGTAFVVSERIEMLAAALGCSFPLALSLVFVQKLAMFLVDLFAAGSRERSRRVDAGLLQVAYSYFL